MFRLAINFFDTVVLDCLDKIDGERTPSAVFHLLKGKSRLKPFRMPAYFRSLNISAWLHSVNAAILLLLCINSPSSYITAGKKGTWKVTARGVQSLNGRLPSGLGRSTATARIIKRLLAPCGGGFPCSFKSCQTKSINAVNISRLPTMCRR